MLVESWVIDAMPAVRFRHLCFIENEAMALHYVKHFHMLRNTFVYFQQNGFQSSVGQDVGCPRDNRMLEPIDIDLDVAGERKSALDQLVDGNTNAALAEHLRMGHEIIINRGSELMAGTGETETAEK